MGRSIDKYLNKIVSGRHHQEGSDLYFKGKVVILDHCSDLDLLLGLYDESEVCGWHLDREEYDVSDEDFEEFETFYWVSSKDLYSYKKMNFPII